MRQLENSMVRRDVRSWEWDRFDDVVNSYMAMDEAPVEDYYLDDFGTEADDEAIEW